MPSSARKKKGKLEGGLIGDGASPSRTFCCFYCSVDQPDIRSFPTRRSSDLLNMTFYPHVEVSQQMAVTPQGHLLTAVQAVGKSNSEELLPGEIGRAHV